MRIQLPGFLDNLIFNVLNGVYQTRSDVDINLHNDDARNKIYLGTYFPRSYAEALVIFDALLANDIIKSTFNNKDVINILDFGTGTGGNIIGLLNSVKNNLQGGKIINLFTVEGNANAIEYQKRIIALYKIYYKTDKNITLNYHPLNCIIASGDSFEAQMRELIQGLEIREFDIVTTFKCITEFYNADYFGSRGLFVDFIRVLGDYLSAEGLMAVIDVTSKDRQLIRPYTSFILSEELNDYLRNSITDLRYIFPKCCSLFYDDCRHAKCYRQRIIEVSHSRAKNDTSKICHAVIGKQEFADRIKNTYDIPNPYPVCYKKSNGSVYIDAVCNNGIPQNA